jgi:hypothetical protein
VRAPDGVLDAMRLQEGCDMVRSPIRVLRAAAILATASLFVGLSPGATAAEPSPAACTSQWLVSSGGIGSFQPLWTDPDGTPIGRLVTEAAAPDARPDSDQWFNASPTAATDVFSSFVRPDGKIGWRVSVDGKNEWEPTNHSVVPAKDLRFGDFDSDGLSDTFVALDQGTGWYRWMFSSRTLGMFKDLAITRLSIDRIRLGDFNGDGTTDVFVPERSGTSWAWKVWVGGEAPAARINLKPTDPSTLRLADVDANSRTDVLTSKPIGDGKHAWLVSWGGTSKWKVLTTQSRPLSAVRFIADFSGDGVLDFFYTTPRPSGYQWWIARWDGPTQSYVRTKLNWSTIKPANLRIGRFDSTAGVDILASIRTCS